MRRAAAPQFEAADAGQCSDRRSQGRQVIGVEDAAGQAVDDAVGERPDAPQRHLRATAAPGEQRAQYRKRQGPGELHGKRRLGKAQRSDRHGIVGDETRRRGRYWRGRRRRRVAHEALQPVMHDDQLEHGIVVAAAGIGPARFGCEVERGRPGKRHDGERDGRRRHPAQPLAPVEVAGQQPARQ